MHFISSTINLEKGYGEVKQLFGRKYKDEAMYIGDPEENPFHEDLSSHKTILAGMLKRTREAQEHGDAFLPT